MCKACHILLCLQIKCWDNFKAGDKQWCRATCPQMSATQTFAYNQHLHLEYELWQDLGFFKKYYTKLQWWTHKSSYSVNTRLLSNAKNDIKLAQRHLLRGCSRLPKQMSGWQLSNSNWSETEESMTSTISLNEV